jgi:hypothetical protein
MYLQLIQTSLLSFLCMLMTCAAVLFPGICPVPNKSLRNYFLTFYFHIAQFRVDTISSLRSNSNCVRRVIFVKAYNIPVIPQTRILVSFKTEYQYLESGIYCTSRGSSVSIVSDCGLDDRVRSPTEADDFSSILCVQTGSGAHPASCLMGTRGSFPGGKVRPGRDADHSPPSSAEVKNK